MKENPYQLITSLVGDTILTTESINSLMKMMLAYSLTTNPKEQDHLYVEYLFGDRPYMDSLNRFRSMILNQYEIDKEFNKKTISKFLEHLKNCMENRNELAHAHTINGYSLENGQLIEKPDILSIKMVKMTSKGLRNNMISIDTRTLSRIHIYTKLTYTLIHTFYYYLDKKVRLSQDVTEKDRFEKIFENLELMGLEIKISELYKEK